MGIQDVEWDKLLLIKPQQDMKGHFPRHPNGAGCHTPMEKPKYLVVNSSLALWRSRIDPKQPKVRHPELLTTKFFQMPDTDGFDKSITCSWCSSVTQGDL